MKTEDTTVQFPSNGELEREIRNLKDSHSFLLGTLHAVIKHYGGEVVLSNQETASVPKNAGIASWKSIETDSFHIRAV